MSRHALCIDYLRARRALMLLWSTLDTKPKWVRLRFCFLVFLVKMWLLYACFLLIFPDPVRANLFLAPELVLILGILLIIWLIITWCQHVTHYILTIDILFLNSYFFLGDSMIIMRLPSSVGIASTLPYSSRSLAKRSSSTSPCSLKSIERPLKKT